MQSDNTAPTDPLAGEKPQQQQQQPKLTCLRDLSSSQLKLLRSKAKKRLSTRKLPITKAGRNTAKHVSGPCTTTTTTTTTKRNEMTSRRRRRADRGERVTEFFSAIMQSHSGSAHSPHRMRKIIMNAWKKSLKFHLRHRICIQHRPSVCVSVCVGWVGGLGGEGAGVNLHADHLSRRPGSPLAAPPERRPIDGECLRHRLTAIETRWRLTDVTGWVRLHLVRFDYVRLG